MIGNPQAMGKAARVAREQGLQPVLVKYPLGYPIRATREVQRQARRWQARGRTVYAYGDSVGGTMAEMLAAGCLVDGAVANSAPPDLLRWPEPGTTNIFAGLRPQLKKISPFHQEQCSPVLAMHSRGDTLVDFRLAAQYARKFTEVHLRIIQGDHLGLNYSENVAGSLRWLLGKAPSGSESGRVQENP